MSMKVSAKRFPSLIWCALLFVCMADEGFAQRNINNSQNAAQQAANDAAPAPPLIARPVKAKYEGGVFGYKKTEGTIEFDDENRRLLFRDKQNRELLSMPYDAILVAYADTRSKTPIASTVISRAPTPFGLGSLALLAKKKFRYLTLQFRDPDTDVAGLTSFKIDNRQTLDSVVYTLGQKAGLTRRGDAFVRRVKKPGEETSN